MTTVAVIRDALATERGALEELQRRASLEWEDDRADLLAHPDAIELPADQIRDGLVRVAVDADSRRLGFSVLLPAARDGARELDGLFVEPHAWRQGVGRALVADCSERALREGALRIDVTANPRAEEFYERVGFRRGEVVATRFRPARRMHLELDRSAPAGSRASASPARR
jgi:GNAT superfamily N-acetyltransferase